MYLRFPTVIVFLLIIYRYMHVAECLELYVVDL